MAKVYISSTYLDLIDHRKRVYEQLRKSRHDVISMEDYNPDSRPPLKKCIEDVKNADIYVGLIAWRYGYIPDKGNPKKLSITEHEYRAAIKSGKEIVLFHVDKKAAWPSDQMDAQAEVGPERINALRAQMTEDHIVGFFNTPDDLAAQLSPAIEQAATKISPELAKELLENLAFRFDYENPDAPPEQLTEFLKDTAKDYKEQKARLNALGKSEARISNLVGAAQAAIDAGKFDKADEYLKDAEEMQLQEHTLIQVRKQSSLRVERGQAALLNGDQEKAASRFLQASKMLEGLGEVEEAGDLLRPLGVDLQKYAGRYGGAGYELGISICRYLLELWNQESSPENWAMVQNDLAIALQEQGTRTGGETGVAFSEQAVVAYRLSLEVYTREAHPMNWAATQMNLANTLQEQGTRTGGEIGIALLEEAAIAYRLSLEVRTREAHPMQWAMTQMNLANVLHDQGTRASGEIGIALLNEAAIAYRLSLEVSTREAHPVNWAMTQMNLAITLKNQGTRVGGEAGITLLEEAVSAYRSSLEVYTREAHPLDWARTQMNLAIALRNQGTRAEGESGVALLEKARRFYLFSLEVYTREAHPVNWAITQMNLAVLEVAWAEHDACDDPTAHLKAALDHVEASLEIYDPVNMPYDYGTATELRDQIQAKLDALS